MLPQQGLKRCPKCGQIVTASLTACSCGHRFSTFVNATVIPQATPGPPPHVTHAPRPKKLSPWLWVFVGAISVAWLGMILAQTHFTKDLQVSQFSPSYRVQPIVQINQAWAVGQRALNLALSGHNPSDAEDAYTVIGPPASIKTAKDGGEIWTYHCNSPFNDKGEAGMIEYTFDKTGKRTITQVY
jgi:hypothetical protein